MILLALQENMIGEPNLRVSRRPETNALRMTSKREEAGKEQNTTAAEKETKERYAADDTLAGSEEKGRARTLVLRAARALGFQG